MDSNNLTILLVEDDQSVRSLLQLEFEELDYRVFTAGSVAEAIPIVENEENIDLCIFDLRLPDGDGFTLLEQVKTKQLTSPVIIITGHGNKGTVLRAIKNGAYDFIEKPFSFFNDVLPTIQRAKEKYLLEKHNASLSEDNTKLAQQVIELFDGFVQASVMAIEHRDPVTKNHSRRVSEMAVELAKAVDRDISIKFNHIKFNDSELEELRYAGLLHDFGKIGVREHILAKSSKLTEVQLLTLKSRFDEFRNNMEIKLLHSYIEKIINSNGNFNSLPPYTNIKERTADFSSELKEYFNIILGLNKPSLVTENVVNKVNDLIKIAIDEKDNNKTLLTKEEVDILSIPKGSLTSEERKEIESHVMYSYNILAKIPWSDNLKQVPSIVVAHHECINGMGYPNQLKDEQIPIQAKILAVVDIFDSLVAVDRPYKKAVPCNKALDILKAEAKSGKIDLDLVELFIKEGIQHTFEYIETQKTA